MKIALITGAGRGIGLATASALALEGFDLFLVARTKSELESAAASIKNIRVVYEVADLSKEADIKRVFECLDREYGGRIDLLVNNAGLGFIKPAIETSPQEFDQVMAINLKAPFILCIEAIKKMKTGGSIINISSLAGVHGLEKFPGFSIYSASKAGLIALTECLAVEAKTLGIRVNCICPGAVDTKMLRDAMPHFETKTKPEDIAKVVLKLVRDSEAKGMTGRIEVLTNV